MILPYIFAMANMGPTLAIPLGPTHLALVWADPNSSLLGLEMLSQPNWAGSGQEGWSKTNGVS